VASGPRKSLGMVDAMEDGLLARSEPKLEDVRSEIEKAAMRELKTFDKSIEEEQEKEPVKTGEGMIFERHFEGLPEEEDLDDIIAEQRRQRESIEKT
jgi:hypothetical protein